MVADPPDLIEPVAAGPKDEFLVALAHLDLAALIPRTRIGAVYLETHNWGKAAKFFEGAWLRAGVRN